ncbi:hypothetical protein, partial [Blautia sp.]|uniref:hypothetical protein n=1 Tax=Blautia sp. TaxID=1955243 RepID=UPI003A9233F1
IPLYKEASFKPYVIAAATLRFLSPNTTNKTFLKKSNKEINAYPHNINFRSSNQSKVSQLHI